MLFFMLQCDPKVALYFQDLARQLVIYVDNSLIVPAFSEVLLPTRNRRHWNLLKGASLAGVRLVVNDAILEELEAHIRLVSRVYREKYSGYEETYTDEAAILYIDEILIRAFFYARMTGDVADFNSFLDEFVSFGVGNMKRELSRFLKDKFDIDYVSDDSLNVTIDKAEEKVIREKLIPGKVHQERAKNDAKLISLIFALRRKNNEAGTGIWGYKTWWLSKDFLTMRAVESAVPGKYQSCYIRPDFLYNYVALAPKVPEVNEVFKSLFPSLIGVNISFHLPEEVTKTVNAYVATHARQDPTRVRAKIDLLSEQLKIDPAIRNRAAVTHILDDELDKFRESSKYEASRHRALSHQQQTHKRKGTAKRKS